MRRFSELANSENKNSKPPFSLGSVRLSALEKGDPIEINPPTKLPNADADSFILLDSQEMGSDSQDTAPIHKVEEKKKTESGPASEIKNLLASLTRSTENATRRIPRKASEVVKGTKMHSSSSASLPPLLDIKTPLELHKSTVHESHQHNPSSTTNFFIDQTQQENEAAVPPEQIISDTASLHEHIHCPRGVAKCHSHPSLNLLNNEAPASNNSQSNEVPPDPSPPCNDSLQTSTIIVPNSNEREDSVIRSEMIDDSVTDAASFAKRPPPPRPPPPSNMKPVLDLQSSPTHKHKPVPSEDKQTISETNHSFRNGLVVFGALLLLLVIAVRISSYLFGFVCGFVLGVLLHFVYTYLNTVSDPTSQMHPPPAMLFSSLRDLPPPLVPEYLAEENVDGKGPSSITTLTTVTTCVRGDEEDPDCCTSSSLSSSPATSFIYKTWMNQLSDYNADSYHLNRTHTVFVTLNGMTLKLERPKERVTKRVLFNDPNVTPTSFISTRVCNLLHAKVVLKPDFLVHKRQWSKKYPICIHLCADYNETYLAELARDQQLESTLRRRGNTNLFATDDSSVMSAPAMLEEDDTSPTQTPEKEVSSSIYLFTRTAREKEHWFRLFQSASLGKPLILSVPQLVKMSLSKTTSSPEQGKKSSLSPAYSARNSTVVLGNEESREHATVETGQNVPRPTNEALLSCYVRHMAKFMPADYLLKASHMQQLHMNYITCDPAYLWINALVGRILWDFLREPYWTAVVKRKIQAKLNKVHLPYFIDGITLMDVDFGSELPVLRRAHRAYLDAFGLWIDIDMAYAGGFSMTVETKLNPMKLRRIVETQKNTNANQQASDEPGGGEEEPSSSEENDPVPDNAPSGRGKHATSSSSQNKRSAAQFSDEEDSAESSGSYGCSGSSDEDEQSSKSPKGRLFRLVNKVVKSQYVAKAMQNKYVKRGMEIVQRTSLVLKVDVENLSGTLCLNIPPPPTDRLWYGFRTNPQLKLCARPRVGDRTITLARIIEFIETKMVAELQQMVVYPNMDDVVVPLLLDNNPRFFGHSHQS